MPWLGWDPVLVKRDKLFDELGQMLASEGLCTTRLQYTFEAYARLRTGNASLAADLFIRSMFLSGLNSRTTPDVASRYAFIPSNRVDA